MRIPRRKPIYPFGDNDALYFGTSNDVGIYWDGTYLVFNPLVGDNMLISFSAARTAIFGGATAGQDLFLRANTTNAQGRIDIMGNAYITGYFAVGSFFSLSSGPTSCFKLTYAANITTVEGGAVAGDDFKLKANSSDDYPYVTLWGGAGISLVATAGSPTQFVDAATPFGDIEKNGDDMKIEALVVNGNVELAPNGTGVVKFGVRTATGDVVSNGHITIKDAAGNVVKLMTTA